MAMHGRTVTDHLTGGPRDIEEAMALAVRNGVAPAVARLPLTDAGSALERLAAGDVRSCLVREPWTA